MTGLTERYAMALLSCLFTLLPVMIPTPGLLLFIFSMAAPAPLVVLGAKHSWRYSLGVIAFEMIVLLMAQGSAALFMALYYAVAPLVMAQAIRLRYTIARTMAWSVMVPCALNMLLLVGYSAFASESPLALLERTIESLLRAAQEHMPLPESPGGAPEANNAEIAMKSFAKTILTLLPAMMVINFLFTNVVNYLLARWYFGRGPTPFVIDPADLGAWRLTDHVVWIFLASGILSMLPATLAQVVGWNVFPLTLALYLLHGIAIVVFWMRRLPLPMSGRWFLAIAAFLFAAPLCLLICMAVGLFDIWLDFRRQRQQPLIC